MDISQKSITELEAIAYQHIKERDFINNNLRQVEAVISTKRAQQQKEAAAERVEDAKEGTPQTTPKDTKQKERNGQPG